MAHEYKSLRGFLLIFNKRPTVEFSIMSIKVADFLTDYSSDKGNYFSKPFLNFVVPFKTLRFDTFGFKWIKNHANSVVWSCRRKIFQTHDATKLGLERSFTLKRSFTDSFSISSLLENISHQTPWPQCNSLYEWFLFIQNKIAVVKAILTGF